VVKIEKEVMVFDFRLQISDFRFAGNSTCNANLKPVPQVSANNLKTII